MRSAGSMGKVFDQPERDAGRVQLLFMYDATGHPGSRKMTTQGSDQTKNNGVQDARPGNATSSGAPPRSSDIEVAKLSRSMLSRLSRTIESEIVPRFMLALDEDEAAADPATGLQEKINEFVSIVVQHDAPVAVEYVGALREQGTPLAEIYLDLLGPAAQQLGSMWETDDLSFAEVAIGVCRMHQVLLEYSRCFDPTDNAQKNGRCALIVPTPGEEHTFGLFMVIEFLRRAGWHCWTGSPATVRDLCKLVRSQHFDAIGISLSADRNVDTTASTIEKVRRSSKNPKAAVILGGRVMNESPDLVTQLGADDTASDGRAAVRVLNKLCGVNNGASARG